MLWSIDVEDMKKEDPDAMVEDLQAQLEYKQRGHRALHDMHWPRVKAFNRLVRWLDGRPLGSEAPRPRRLADRRSAEYLKETAAAPQPYATREELEKVRRAVNEGRMMPPMKP